MTVPPPGAAGLLDARSASAALAVAGEVAARVADPARVPRLVAGAAAQTAHPASVHWRDHAVGQGHAGLALLFGTLDHHLPGQGWDRTAHRHLEVAARAAESLPDPPSGLFAGLAGIGLVASCLAAGTDRYRRLLATIDEALAARVPALAARLGGPLGRPGAPGVGEPGRAGGFGVREFDLISGLSGVAAYLLLRRTAPKLAPALRVALGGLVELTGSDPIGPRWRTPPGHLLPDERARHPNGSLNCGLAHGIPGPLAVLSLALPAGAEVPGLATAVTRAASWVARHRTDDAAGPNWPSAVPLSARPATGAAGPIPPTGVSPSGSTGTADPDRPPPVAPARSAWCYGGPGVAASLRLAGEALADPGLRDLAAAALTAALARTDRGRRIGSPTFCHGRAGLLSITATFARATGDAGFRQAAAAMAADLLERFDPATPLGYQDLESGGRAVDHPALLSGAPGVALALLGATSPTEPSWGRLFLLA